MSEVVGSVRRCGESAAQVCALRCAAARSNCINESLAQRPAVAVVVWQPSRADLPRTKHLQHTCTPDIMVVRGEHEDRGDEDRKRKLEEEEGEDEGEEESSVVESTREEEPHEKSELTR